MLSVLLRMLLPLVFFYLLIRFIQDMTRRPRPPGGDSDVIDICPQCGRVRGAGHRCP